jgi:hypothetical protein
VRFFFDNCISSNLTDAMRLLNEPHHQIEHLTDRFDPDALDPDWLHAISVERELIVVSADPAITSSKKESKPQTGLVESNARPTSSLRLHRCGVTPASIAGVTRSER